MEILLGLLIGVSIGLGLSFAIQAYIYNKYKS